MPRTPLRTQGLLQRSPAPSEALPGLSLVGSRRDRSSRRTRQASHHFSEMTVTARVDVVLGDRARRRVDVARSSPAGRPVGAAHEDDREVLDLAGLDEGQRLEQLVERAEAAGQDHERVARTSRTSSCARRSSGTRSPRSTYGLSACSCGSSMLQPIERPPASWQPRLAASMTPGPAAGDDGEAGLGQQPPQLARQLVDWIALGRARRAEHGHGRPDAGQRVEAFDELGQDPQRRATGPCRGRRFGSPRKALVGSAGPGGICRPPLAPDHEPPCRRSWSRPVVIGSPSSARARVRSRSSGRGRGRGIAAPALSLPVEHARPGDRPALRARRAEPGLPGGLGRAGGARASPLRTSGRRSRRGSARSRAARSRRRPCAGSPGRRPATSATVCRRGEPRRASRRTAAARPARSACAGGPRSARRPGAP